ncbi:MAG: IS91 family transposase [Bacteroidetes bacterium]|nr:IS91 family transposase [Bacteroidota bacterium]
MMKTNNKIGSLFREFGAPYRTAHPLPLAQHKALRAIERCRTAALGGHVDRCDHCGYERISYNSCRNRHCPNCQSLARERWLLDRKRELLPICYFHIVFTIPDELNPIALVNQRLVYDLLFQAASETLLTLVRDPRHVGGVPGIIAVLHTWGQNLMDHPHLHCIVTGGGLSEDGQSWLSPRKMTPGKVFFIHVKVISDLFKKKFLAYLKQRYQAGEFKWVGRINYLQDAAAFRQLLNQLYAKPWVVYCKKPFGGPKQVLGYLGRYTHRVAISNQRIVKIAAGKVTFKWRDYRDGSKTKLMTLDVFEFMRRFLLHILPYRYYKIRYYGLFSNRYRKAKLSCCQQILEVIQDEFPERLCWEDLLLELCGLDVRKCPHCQIGRMVRKELWCRSSGVPP